MRGALWRGGAGSRAAAAAVPLTGPIAAAETPPAGARSCVRKNMTRTHWSRTSYASRAGARGAGACGACSAAASAPRLGCRAACHAAPAALAWRRSQAERRARRRSSMRFSASFR
jgi:hypothetical protein